MVDALLIIFWGIVLLTVIIVVHEWGHFIAARLFGVRVTEFAIGLPGPSIGHVTKKGTRIALTAIPLGGYNRIAGMGSLDYDIRHLARAYAYLCKYGTLRTDELPNDADRLDFDLVESLEILKDWGTIDCTRAKDGSRADIYLAKAMGEHESGTPREVDDAVSFIESEHAQTYDARPFWKRVCILLAGSLFNLLFFFIVVIALMMALGGYEAGTTFESVVEGSPAAEAGFVQGDTLVAVDGTDIGTWEEFTQAMSGAAPGDEMFITVDHEGTPVTHTVVLGANDTNGAYLGVSVGYVHRQYGFVEAVELCGYYTSLVFGVMVSLFNPFEFQQTIQNCSSVVGVSYVAKDAASSGMGQFLLLCAEVSLSVGLFNLLPILPLDGGKIVIEIYQRVSRKVASIRFQNWYTALGMAFFLFIFMVTVFQDVNTFMIG